MPEYGYFLPCEEFSPDDLIEQAGAASLRIRPSVVAAATCAMTGPFRLGVGSGEALNEHVLGGPWPPARVRLEMLEEAIQVMRRLFSGEEVSHDSPRSTVENARLCTVPDEPVPVDVSGFGPQWTRLAARVGDGSITTMPDEALVSPFLKVGGAGKMISGGTKVCYGPDRDEAVRTARRLWFDEVLPGEMSRILPSPRHFEQLEPLVTERMVRENVVCGDDVDARPAALNAFAEAGFDRVHVTRIGPGQRGFFDFYRTKVLPQLARD
ncbi:TIGR03557 family F420-dependent LLM class oxidoreductase [Streptomyces sp. CoH27]|uniref:TIGR03557 family F420-dependent LLM class oxidoreductase n=1 Tax=Streptomyces sp. CoH27 TaxID=2875763 RepID=UPI001CD35083|nr:TIGR03557 family F420-dependent LLM class oxidoreductase [Streptomyces sp. CoH27]